MSPPTPDWSTARDLSQFGYCMAAWITGEIGPMLAPAYGSTPPRALRRVVPQLARVNRGGKLVIVNAQPACLPRDRRYGGRYDMQRAAVEGFVGLDAIDDVRDIIERHPELILEAHRPGSRSLPPSHVVSTHASSDVVWFGRVLSRPRLTERYNGLHPELIATLHRAWQVLIVDDQWGRNSVLWRALLELSLRHRFPGGLQHARET